MDLVDGEPNVDHKDAPLHACPTDVDSRERCEQHLLFLGVLRGEVGGYMAVTGTGEYMAVTRTGGYTAVTCLGEPREVGAAVTLRLHCGYTAVTRRLQGGYKAVTRRLRAWESHERSAPRSTIPIWIS